jgi:class 3 adenylate cyclase
LYIHDLNLHQTITPSIKSAGSHLFSLCALLILLSCSQDSPYPASELVKTDSKVFNYFLNARGDTIKTGVPVQIEPFIHVINKPPQKFALGPPKIIKHHSGEHPLGSGKLAGSVMRVASELQARIEPIRLEFKSEPLRFSRKQEISFGSKESNGIFRIRELSMNQGLTSNDIALPAQDSNGVLWYCHGPIISIDGKYVREYVAESGEVFGIGLGITRDGQQRMWMNYGWGNYLCYFDGKQIHQLSNHSYDILGTNSDEELVLYKDSAIYRLRGDSLEFLCSAFWINFGVKQCYGDSDGSLFIPGDHGYYGVYKNDTLISYNLKVGSGRINAISKAPDGSLWFACDSGLCSLNEGVLTTYGTDDGLSGENAREILVDGNRRLWISYLNGAIDIIYEGVLYKLDDSDLRAFRSRNGSARIMFLDSDDRVWLCSNDGSFFILDETYLHTLIPSAIGSGELYGDLARADNGDVWISGKKGLYKYSRDGLISFYDDLHRRFKIDNERLSIAHDGLNLWVGFGGPNFAAMIKNDTVQLFGREQAITKSISDIEIDREGVVWLGGPEGLLSYDGQTFSDRLPWIEGHVNEMSIDHQGQLVLAHSSGRFFQHNKNNWMITGSDEGLDIRPWTVESVDSNALLAGSWTTGLEYLTGSQTLRIDRNSGLINNAIISISNDPLGNIWIRTESGLNVLNHQNVQEHLLQKTELAVDYLNHRDGLQFNSFAWHMDDVYSGDSLWFSNLEVVHILDYRAYADNNAKAHLKLTDLLLNEQQVDFSFDTIEGVSYNPPKPFTNIPENLVVDYTHNNLLFEFSNLDLSAPHVNKYRFRIKKLSEEWSRASTVGQAEYTNLPPGKFTFEVQVLGHGFKWSEPLQYSFQVLPPWYRTWLAYIVYLAMFGIVVSLFARWQNRRLQAENQKLEALVSNRTAELRTEKKKSDELLLNILPAEIAAELKQTGQAEARTFENVSILFSDLVGFTSLAESIEASALVDLLNTCFKAFDEIMRKHGVEKIKTIGDAYMAASGLSETRAGVEAMVYAALEMQDVVRGIAENLAKHGEAGFQMRIGIHTGHVVAGIVGLDKFQYDLWGDAVNTAFRMEEHGEPGKVNISQSTYDHIKDRSQFVFESRGKIAVKGKGEIVMYFVSRA